MNPNYDKAIDILNEINDTGFAGNEPKGENGILRPTQVHALKEILFAIYAKNKKYVVLTAPTGSGKSWIAGTLAKIVDQMLMEDTNITTSSRALQSQYGESFYTDNDFKVVMGTTNYACSVFKDKEGNPETAGTSPCQDPENDFAQTWSKRNIKIARKKGQIFTTHADQDIKVVLAAGQIESGVSEALGEFNTAVSEREDYEGPNIDASVIKKGCKKKNACSFYNARRIADDAPIAIRTIQHLLFYILYGVSENRVPIMQQRDLHINDECHSIESVFRDFFSVTVSDIAYDSTITRLRDKFEKDFNWIDDFSEYKKSPGKDWTDQEKENLLYAFYNDVSKVVKEILVSQENEIRGGVTRLESAEDFLRAMSQKGLKTDIEMISDEEKSLLKWFKNLHHAISDVELKKEKKAKGFKHQKKFGYEVSDGKKQGLIFTVYPLTLEGMVERYFGRKYNVFMSATPQPQDVFEKMFGIVGQVAYVEIASDFPPERSPILYDGVETVTIDRAKALGMPFVKSFRNEADRQIQAKDLGWDIIHAKLAIKIREIVERKKQFSGIVPCNSYKMVSELKKNLSDMEGFIWAEDGAQNKLAIEEFKSRAAKKQPAYLVSAGIAEGHSFDDEISRLQIIPKMPYAPYNGIMKQLCERWGNSYYDSKTANTLQQMAGRSMRSKSDYCLTIVLDEKFESLKLPRLHKYYSKHFLSCIKWDEDWKKIKLEED